MPNYKFTRNWENQQIAIIPGVGEYGIPVIQPELVDTEHWIGFNYARTCEDPENHGVHFFVDDYQFIRVWTNPHAYLERLRKFDAVCSPDFSVYTDFPKALQIYNHWRKHWLAAYWQRNGITVIPTIAWSDPSSFRWCFDGEPIGGCVAVSSLGCMKYAETRELFIRGYREMLRRLEPERVIFYGSVPDECEGNIFRVKSFQSKWDDD